MSEQPTFRDQVLAHLKTVLGAPEEIPVQGGKLYRWVLKRPNNLNLHVTLDSPEFPELGHLLISDPCATGFDPVSSVTVRTMPEAKAVAERIVQQWQELCDTRKPAR